MKIDRLFSIENCLVTPLPRRKQKHRHEISNESSFIDQQLGTPYFQATSKTWKIKLNYLPASSELMFHLTYVIQEIFTQIPFSAQNNLQRTHARLSSGQFAEATGCRLWRNRVNGS